MMKKLRALTAILVATASAVAVAPSASAESPTSMRDVALAFSLALGRGDTAVAMSYVRGATSEQEASVVRTVDAVAAQQTDIWTHVTDVSCRGVICLPQPWWADPPTGLYMRREAGKWWVGGNIWSMPVGPLHLAGSNRIFDPTTGRSAKASVPQGVAYWISQGPTTRDRVLLKTVRRGRETSAYVHLPRLKGGRPQAFACVTRMRADEPLLTYHRGRESLWGFTEDGGPWSLGWSASIEGPVWRAGSLLRAEGLFTLDPLVTTGSFSMAYRQQMPVDANTLTRSTRRATGGAAWNSITTKCDERRPS